ncbi:acetyl-CoA carboxylase carboxyltransferase subunit alpha [Bacillota bacterium LX-D]|nr:acetyl-CoA carboxylase carboxyltransferase subunit alpha [Bacillota bacterium LX-D]
MLAFEKELEILVNKIKDLEEFSAQHNIDLQTEINALKNKEQEIRRKIYSDLTPYERVQLARVSERPNTMDYINNIFTDFIELHGDRSYRDDLSIVGGLARFEGIPVTVIGHRKGRGTKENLKYNFGSPYPEGYRKALRLMKQAEKFGRPIITFIDTAGAYCGIGAEERGQGEAIARNLMEMIDLQTPIVSVLIGEGGSGGALALAIADRFIMLENAIFSVISVEGCASILFKDSSRAGEAAAALKLTADDLLGFSLVDEVISEPSGGAHHDPKLTMQRVKDALIKHLEQLQVLPKAELLEHRFNKYRSIS